MRRRRLGDYLAACVERPLMTDIKLAHLRKPEKRRHANPPERCVRTTLDATATRLSRMLVAQNGLVEARLLLRSHSR